MDMVGVLIEQQLVCFAIHPSSSSSSSSSASSSSCCHHDEEVLEGFLEVRVASERDDEMRQ